MKISEKVVLGLIIFIPVSFSIYFEKSWQESLILLLASCVFILLINIEKYEILKLSKDGVEIKTKIMELDVYLIELKKNVVNLLNIQMDVVNRIGNNAYGSYHDIKEIIKTVEQGKLDDPTIEKKIKAMRKKLVYSMIRQLEIQYSDLKRSKNPEDSNAQKAWSLLIERLIPNYSDKGYNLNSFSEEFEVPSKEIIVHAVEEYAKTMNEYYPKNSSSCNEWKRKTMEIINFSYTD